MKSYELALITDSGCDLPDDVLQEHDIALVPLYITWGGEQLLDRVDIQPAEFYRRLVRDPVHPQTSQPTSADFTQAIERATARGADEAVIITISSGMSSTYNSAMVAAEAASIPVHVIDSRANSMSQGWQVIAAAKARAAGADVDGIRAAVESVRARLVTRLYVDTLEYLRRGGRIGRAASWLGMTLNIKPLLMVDHTSGKIEPRSRVRSRKQALDQMVKDFFEQMPAGAPVYLGLLHGNAPEEAQALAEQLRSRYPIRELVMGMTSPVMGVHTGPGAMALCGYAEE